jgi:hypothetical protein
VKKVAKFIAYVFFFLAMVIFFTPKTNLYYKAEQFLQNYKVTVGAESVKDNGFSLDVSDSVIYAVDGIESAKVDNISIMILGLYNSVSVENIVLASAAANFVPTKVDHLEATLSIINPINIALSGYGDFGEMFGSVNLKERHLSITLEPSKLMKQRFRNTMKMLKKSETGAYVYEYSF